MIPALGGPERKLAEVAFDYGVETQLSWSPDGRLLAFTDRRPEGPWGISLLDVAKGTRRWLAHPSSECQWTWTPAFAPDGASVAMGCLLSIGLHDLFVAPVSGGPARRVAHLVGSVDAMVWTPDGKDLVLVWEEKGLARVPASGGEVEALLFGPDATSLALSRDGRRLAYSQKVVNMNIWQVPLTPKNTAAGPPVRVVTSSRVQGNPEFSPDGRSLRVESLGSPGDLDQQRGRLRRGGRHVVQRTSDRVAAMVSEREHDRIRLARGGPRHPLPRELGRRHPQADGDGADRQRGARLVARRPLALLRCQSRRGHSGVQGTPRGRPGDPIDATGRWARSGPADLFRRPRGLLLWRRPRAPALWSASTSGGDKRRVAGIPEIPAGNGSSWKLVPEGIYFVAPGKEPHQGIDFLDFATGRVHRVVDIAGRMATWDGGRLAVSPDRKSLLFAQIDDVKSDLMLVENFR